MSRYTEAVAGVLGVAQGKIGPKAAAAHVGRLAAVVGLHEGAGAGAGAQAVQAGVAAAPSPPPGPITAEVIKAGAGPDPDRDQEDQVPRAPVVAVKGPGGDRRQTTAFSGGVLPGVTTAGAATGRGAEVAPHVIHGEVHSAAIVQVHRRGGRA